MRAHAKPVIAIIQARMGSTRLPGKVLRKVLGKTLLELQIERLRRARNLNQIIVATTTDPADQQIVEETDRIQIQSFRGDHDDVLRRFRDAADFFGAQTVVRFTADCPLIDPELVDLLIDRYLLDSQVEFSSNTLERTFPRGLDTEVFSIEWLKRACDLATEAFDREHVTRYIYSHCGKSKIFQLKNEMDWSVLRWTVDTEEDFQVVSEIFQKLYPLNPEFRWNDALDLVQHHSNLRTGNAHIPQKAG